MINDKKPLEALYKQLLESDPKHLDRMKNDAKRAGAGIKTGIMLHSKTAKGETKDFELYIPRYAVTMLVARTGGGKTSKMVNMSRQMVQNGAQGMFITLEEPGFAIRAKMMASYSRSIHINHSMEALSTWDATRVIAGDKTHADEAPFNKEIMRHIRIVDANSSVDMKHVETPTVMYQPQFIADLIQYRNSLSDRPLDFVMIDFGQLMESLDSDNSSSYLRMKAVMQALKNLAGSLGIAVVVGGQMKREVYNISIWDWEPEMVRDGSDMEQAASLMIAIGQDKKYSDPEWNMAIRFLKNRYGPKRVAGMFNIEFERCFIPTHGRNPENDA